MVNKQTLRALLALAPICISQAVYSQTQAAAASEKVETIEVTGQFLGSGSKSAMKLDVPVRDTPFSVSSYSDAFMKAIETTNVADLYKYMTGVARTGGSGNDLNIRGFSMTAEDRNATLVDGLPGLAGRFGSPPTVMVDHIEVVKGPASVLYGTAQPGGFVNIVSKRPEPDQTTVIDLKGMAYKGDRLKLSDATGYAGSVDVTGPIDTGKRSLYRLVAERVDQDFFRDSTHETAIYLAPSLTWKLSPVTSVGVLFEHRKSDKTYDLFLAVPNNNIAQAAPITTHYQMPDDFRNEASNALSFNANHAFDNGIKWNLGARLVKHHDDAAGWDQIAFLATGFARDGTPCTGAVPCLRMRARGQHNERQWDFVDTNLNIPFNTGPIGHKVLVGLNGGREIADFHRLQFFPSPACTTPTTPNCLVQNLYHPVYDFPRLDTLPIGALNHPVTTSYAGGIYLSDVMTLSEMWKATGGVRYATERQRIKEELIPNTPDQNKTTQKAIPMAGILFQPSKQWTFYTSYATSYVPAPPSAQDTTGRNPFQPITAKQIEAGAKLEMAKGLGTASLAVYKIDKKNALSSFNCPSGVVATGTCSEQVGAEQSKGLELEWNMRLLPDWQITAGYSYTDAKVVSDVDHTIVGGVSIAGARLVNSPRNSLHVWSRYDFRGALTGWGFGVGVNYAGERAGTLPNATAPTDGTRRMLMLPSYTLVDLGVYYTISRYDFAIKVGNLFDRRFYEASGFESGALQVLPGEPRKLQVSMRVNF